MKCITPFASEAASMAVQAEITSLGRMSCCNHKQPVKHPPGITSNLAQKESENHKHTTDCVSAYENILVPASVVDRFREELIAVKLDIRRAEEILDDVDDLRPPRVRQHLVVV